MNVREPGKTYCDRCDRPITDEAPGHHKYTFNFHDVCPTPNSPDNTKGQFKLNTPLNELREDAAGYLRAAYHNGQNGLGNATDMQADLLMRRSDAFTAALQQTIEAGASKHHGCGCHQDAKFLNVSTITKAFNTVRGKE